MKTKKEKGTTIWVRVSVAKKLMEIAHPDQSYNGIIEELIRYYEEKK